MFFCQVPRARQAAEATLLSFRSSRGVIPACQHILEKSSNVHARFQAALALKDGAIREWNIMGQDARRALRLFLLHSILRYSAFLGAAP